MIFSPGWAENPYSGYKINLFNKNNDIQTKFNDAVKEIEKRFDDTFHGGDVKTIINNAATIGGRIPVLGEIFGIASDIVNTVAQDGDWQSEIKSQIDKKIEQQNPITEVDNMLKQFRLCQKKMNIIKKLGKEHKNYNTHVIKAYDELHEMIDKFSDFGSLSHQKPYPLVGSQVLIALSLAVAAFESIAVDVMPDETKEIALPCQAHDLLTDYRSYAVDARFDKLSGLHVWDVADVKNLPFKSDGYTADSSPNCKNSNTNDDNKCTKDQFSASKYCHTDSNCRIGYYKHVRHQIEKVFPVEQLEKICKSEWPEREITGKINRFE